MANKNTKIKNQTISNENEMAKFIKLIVLITILFLIFYGITILLTKEKKKEETKKPENPVTIQYDTILIGNLLQQPEDAYYVLIEEMEDKNISTYEMYISAYKNVEKSDRVYTAILNHPMNASFVGDVTKTDIENIKDLKLKETTLVKVEKGKITKTVVGHENLMKYFQELMK